MVLPLAVIAPLLMASAVSGIVNSGVSLYNQSRQRDLYNYQIGGYQRQLADWKSKVGKYGRRIRYPELSYPGHIRSLQTGIDQSYASSIGSGAVMASSAGGLYKAYSKMDRWL